MISGVVVLTGGVGGAKLVDGLYRSVPSGTLSAIVNTGDDFTHLGLAVSPGLPCEMIDTLMLNETDRSRVARSTLEFAARLS